MAQITITAEKDSQNLEGVAIINAPLASVFAVHVEKDLFAQWQTGGATVHELNPTAGGAWHFTDAEGYEFMGYFHEVALNTRIVQTFEFMSMPERGDVALDKIIFEAIDENTTKLTTCTTFQSTEARDEMVQSGADEGMKVSFTTLEKIAQDNA